PRLETSWRMLARVRRRPRLAETFLVRDVSFGSRRALAELESHRYVHHCGRAAVMFMARSHVIGLTTCQRKCVRAPCVQHFRSASAKAMYLWLKAGRWTSQRRRIFPRHLASLA